MLNYRVFLERRQRLLQELPTESAVVIFANQECLRNGDAHYPFRQDSNFYYLTGFTEPDAVLFLRKTLEGVSETLLFCHPRNPKIEMWVGPRLGVEAAPGALLVEQAFALQEWSEQVPSLLKESQYVYCDTPDRLQDWLSPQKSHVQPISEVIGQMRLIKGQEELTTMRQAANISVKAHQAAMAACRPGLKEYELEAVLWYEMCRHGSRFPAYESIVAGGANACVLHYTRNRDSLKSGDLVLIDAGAEYDYYASDITRTFPVNGRFSSEQKALYEVVLSTQLAVIGRVRPGVSWESLGEVSQRKLTEGLRELGILSGSVESLLEQKAGLPFYKHRVGHWLGMDVHDAGLYIQNRQSCHLQAGMVFTVEPGLYIDPGYPGIDPKWWGIGIRIEDDVLVTEQGYDVLTAGLVKTIPEIEALVGTAC